MAWIADEYRRLNPTEIDSLACVTGKPISKGGVYGRKEATGRGVFYAITEFLKYPDDCKRIGLSNEIEDQKIIIHGFGNVGYYAAKFLSESGAKIIAIIERNGSITNEQGINIESSKKHFTRKGTLEGLNGFTKTRNRLLTKECDILIPASIDNIINVNNAKNIKAKLIVEGANGPVTVDADKVLQKKGVRVLPDFYANAGGVVVSYFEWVKNLSKIRYGMMQEREEEKRQANIISALETMTEKDIPEELKTEIAKGSTEIDLVRSGLEEKMSETFELIHEKFHSDKKVKDLRTAALMISVKKIADAYSYLGI